MGAADLTATAALLQAATDLNQTLTPHDVAIERAALASQQLDDYLRTMQGIGILKLFNAEFKRRRIAASASGERFITSATAMKRLRMALVPLLVADEHGGKNRPPVGQSVFASVFG